MVRIKAVASGAIVQIDDALGCRAPHFASRSRKRLGSGANL